MVKVHIGITLPEGEYREFAIIFANRFEHELFMSSLSQAIDVKTVMVL